MMKAKNKRHYRHEVTRIRAHLRLVMQSLRLSRTRPEVACHLEIMRLLLVRYRELYYSNPKYRGKDSFGGMKARAHEQNLRLLTRSFMPAHMPARPCAHTRIRPHTPEPA